MADDPSLVSFIRGIDIPCWQEAISIHNGNLERGSKNKKYIPENNGDDKFSPIDLQELLRLANETLDKLDTKGGPVGQIFFQVVEQLHKNSKVIDVLIQLEPRTMAAIWGSVRFLVQVIIDGEEASRLASEGLLHLTRHMGRWKDMAAAFEQSKGTRQALVNLYVEIVGFLLSVTPYSKDGSWKRFVRSVFSSQKDKMQRRLDKLQAAATALEQEVQFEATRSNIETGLRVKAHYEDFKAYAQDNAQQFENLSRQVTALADYAAWHNAWSIMQEARLTSLSKLLEMKKPASPDQIMHWLSSAASSEAPAIPATEETYRGFLCHTLYQSWIHSSKPGLLHVVGKPECGKTFISYAVFSRLLNAGERVLYHSFDLDQQSSSFSILAASLVEQLLRVLKSPDDDQFTNAVDKLGVLCERYKRGPCSCPPQELWRLARQLLNMCPRYFLVVDGLDEFVFDDAHSPDLANVMSVLTELPKQSGGSVMVFSRSCSNPDGCLGSHAHLIMDEKIVTPGIRNFVSTQLFNLSLPSEDVLEVTNYIAASAEGNYQWVAIVVDYLKSGVSVDIKRRLKDFPVKLGEAYDQSLRHISESMDGESLEMRYNILSMVCGAQRPLTSREIAASLGIRPVKLDQTITRLCKPLATSVDGVVRLSHSSVKDFLQGRLPLKNLNRMIYISSEKSDALLAIECFKTLLDDPYASLDRIGHLLRTSFRVTSYANIANVEETRVSYAYASRFWFIHTVAVSMPSTELLRLLDLFLHNFQFVYWSENSIQSSEDFFDIKSALQKLKKWHESLRECQRQQVHLGNYFSQPYRDISEAYKKAGQDFTLQWLALMRLGSYYFGIADVPTSITVREQVATGLQKLLGPRNALTLKARADMAFSYLAQGYMRKAFETYDEIVNLQREVLGTEDPEYFLTMVYKGQAQYYMGDFVSSIATQAESSAGLLVTSGPESFLYLASRLWYALPMVQIGQLNLASDILEPVLRKRREKNGVGDSTAIFCQVAIGDVQRKAGAYNESITSLKDALEARLAEYHHLHHFLVLDVAIELLIALWADRRHQDALELLERIEMEGQTERLLERYHQVSLLKSLLLSEQGDLDAGIDLLQSILIRTTRDSYNRALLWIIVDLADMLRRRGRNGDEKQASSNFDNIVVDKDTATMNDEATAFASPDPPRLLTLAEKALRLVRDRKFDEARCLLKQENIQWAREEDFWLWVGGPAADTAWLKA